MTRSISEIALEIDRKWKPKVHYSAIPYLEAMYDLDRIDSMFHNDTAKSVVLYFLSNASTWRGEDARRIKAELKGMIK